jgi:hypothetical protein
MSKDLVQAIAETNEPQCDHPVAEDFGHVALKGKVDNYVVRVDGWGVGPFIIICGTNTFRFEDSDRFGPHLVNKDGSICANPWPPEKSTFWPAYAKWRDAGRPLAADGITCTFTASHPTSGDRTG